MTRGLSEKTDVQSAKPAEKVAAKGSNSSKEKQIFTKTAKKTPKKQKKKNNNRQNSLATCKIRLII